LGPQTPDYSEGEGGEGGGGDLREVSLRDKHDQPSFKLLGDHVVIEPIINI
jgi:hypothetical protein